LNSKERKCTEIHREKRLPAEPLLATVMVQTPNIEEATEILRVVTKIRDEHKGHTEIQEKMELLIGVFEHFGATVAA
jgi:hypothetical protein